MICSEDDIIQKKNRGGLYVPAYALKTSGLCIFEPNGKSAASYNEHGNHVDDDNKRDSHNGCHASLASISLLRLHI